MTRYEVQLWVEGNCCWDIHSHRRFKVFISRKPKDYKILGYEVTTTLVSLADNLLKF